MRGDFKSDCHTEIRVLRPPASLSQWARPQPGCTSGLSVAETHGVKAFHPIVVLSSLCSCLSKGHDPQNAASLEHVTTSSRRVTIFPLVPRFVTASSPELLSQDDHSMLSNQQLQNLGLVSGITTATYRVYSEPTNKPSNHLTPAEASFKAKSDFSKTVFFSLESPYIYDPLWVMIRHKQVGHLLVTAFNRPES